MNKDGENRCSVSDSCRHHPLLVLLIVFLLLDMERHIGTVGQTGAGQACVDLGSGAPILGGQRGCVCVWDIWEEASQRMREAFPAGEMVQAKALGQEGAPHTAGGDQNLEDAGQVEKRRSGKECRQRTLGVF